MSQGPDGGGIAGGDIYPMTFVKQLTTEGNIVVCGQGDVPIGVSQKDTRRTQLIETLGRAAAVGEPIGYYRNTRRCFIKVGAAAVAVGDALASDASGNASTTTVDGIAYGARALQPGAAGDLILCEVDIGYHT